MIKQFKKWLTVGTVNSKYNLFKFAILSELILLIALVICICSNISLKKDIKNLEKVNDHNQMLFLKWQGTLNTPPDTNDRVVILDENYIPQTKR